MISEVITTHRTMTCNLVVHTPRDRSLITARGIHRDPQYFRPPPPPPPFSEIVNIVRVHLLKPLKSKAESNSPDVSASSGVVHFLVFLDGSHVMIKHM